MITKLNPASLVGLQQDVAAALIANAGMAVKLQVPGLPACLTADYRPDRVVLVVASGVVVNAHLG